MIVKFVWIIGPVQYFPTFLGLLHLDKLCLAELQDGKIEVRIEKQSQLAAHRLGISEFNSNQSWFSISYRFTGHWLIFFTVNALDK